MPNRKKSVKAADVGLQAVMYATLGFIVLGGLTDAKGWGTSNSVFLGFALAFIAVAEFVMRYDEKHPGVL